MADSPPPLLGFNHLHLPIQRVSLCTLLRYPFLVTGPWAPIYTNFLGKRAPRKRPDFSGLIFFQIFVSRAENLAKIGSF